jgi:uncharacterized membrane protein
MENVLAVTFTEDAKAYEALTTLKQLDTQNQVDLAEAAVVVRGEDGRLDTRDEVDGGDGLSATAGGGLIGLVIGILGGPFGVLIGGATGLLIGSLFDMDDEDDTESALADISRSVQVGRTAVLAQVNEQSPDVIDAAFGSLGATIVRRSLEDVEAEIAAAEKAQKAARRAARKELREHRREQAKEKIDAKIEELKAKLHRDPVGAGSA